MTLIVRPGFMFDADASTYIEAVEVADTQALETATRYAINDFVIGCKQDGIWPAIKASCILAGARTLNGALTPLAGTAPTNFNFVSGDYNRKTGLVGNGSTKYLDSNRNNNADPQNSLHFSIYASTLQTSDSGHMISTGLKSYIVKIQVRNNSLTGEISFAQSLGFCGTTRPDASGFTLRNGGVNTTSTAASTSADNINFNIFRRADSGSQHSNARLAFYSIGESLNLAALDARVSALITAFGAAIP